MEIKVWTKEEVIENLQKKEIWVLRGVLAIYEYQTQSEKISESTHDYNNVGFNGIDGKILTSFGNQLNRQKQRNQKLSLSPKQMIIAKKKIIKYAGQLTKIANKEQ